MASSLAAIHVAKKQLGLDDDTYRAKLSNIVGKDSAGDMTEAERQKVLTVFRNEGFRPAAEARRPNGRAKLSGKYAGKLQALWIAGWNLGVFRERDDAALVKFVKRQTGIDAVRFLYYPDDASKAIEAIKAIIARDGGVDWSARLGKRSIGHRIAAAQWIRLRGTAEGFLPAVHGHLGKRPSDEITPENWITVMNWLGEQVRALKKGDA